MAKQISRSTQLRSLVRKIHVPFCFHRSFCRENGRLLVYPTGYATETSSSSPNSYISTSYDIWHSCLSHGLPVLAAGELYFAPNHSLYWNNYSGHYLPDATSLMALQTWIHTQSSESMGNDHVFRIHASRQCNSFQCREYQYEFSDLQLRDYLSGYPFSLLWLSMFSSSIHDSSHVEDLYLYRPKQNRNT